MTSAPQKSAVASAISLVMGAMASVPTSADTITQIQITDVGSILNGKNGGGSGTYSTALDGNSGGFSFQNINPTTYNNVNGWTSDVGPLLGQGQTNSTGSFTTGFIFSNTPFIPFTFGNGFSGDIIVDETGELTLSIDSLDFGGLFESGLPGSGEGTNFELPPDTGTLKANWVENGSNTDEKRVSFQWAHLITTAEDGTGNFINFNASWVIEGVATVADGAPLIFLNDAGGGTSEVPGDPDPGDAPTEVSPNISYLDPGAVCQDVVDGEILSLVDGDVNSPPPGRSFVRTINNPNNPNTGNVGDTFTVDYKCTDSAANVATVTRPVEVVNDTSPPAISLKVGADETGRRDSEDGASVDILVGVRYEDAGATCVDNVDGTIPVGPRFSVNPDPPTVDTSVPSDGNPITFTCVDRAGNGPVTATRSVNVVADDEAPEIELSDEGMDATITLGGVWVDTQSTCSDGNPIDEADVDITYRLDINPPVIDANGLGLGTHTVTYDCVDEAGNAAVRKTREVEVVTGENFRIISMTITDLDPKDGLAGCFRFNRLNEACDGANQFSSDDSGGEGTEGTGTERILGEGKDTDAQGNTVGIKFGEFQPVREFTTPPPSTIMTSAEKLPVGRIAPGFLFTAFPFVPATYDPSTEPGSKNKEVATVPRGFVTDTGSEALLTMESLPFAGVFQSRGTNLFFLDPDEGTFDGTITAINDYDENAPTRTFNYLMTWNHLITPEEDPTGDFNFFNAFWRLEGVITTNSEPFVINFAPRVNAVSASQDGDPTTIVVSDGGPVTVTVGATDPERNELVFDWSQNALAVIGATNESTFSFDPSDLPAGPLAVRVTVTDTFEGDADTLSDVGEIVLMVEPTAPALSDAEDSDGDGASDADEGFGDDDGDSIANYQDPIDGTVDPGRNRVDFRDPSSGDIVTSAGRLRLGRAASAAGNGTFIATEKDIEQYGGPGATPTGNAHDRLNDVDGIGPVSNGIRDFIIDGLTTGETVQIVIPQNQPLPSVPQYRKYTPATGWVPFSRVSGNAWASAPKVDGVCPPPDDPAYDSPLDDAQRNTLMVEGDECLRLTIVDGGANDADRTRNGIIIDPGTVSGNGAASSASSSSGGCTVAGSTRQGTRGDWWLVVAGLLGLLGCKRNRRASASLISRCRGTST